MQALFLTFLFFSVYSYFFFPLILWFLQRFLGKQWNKGATMPPVSIIISVYNEEAVIREKIENALLLDYPPDLLEIIVSSDGSTDKTHEIVAGIEDPRLVLKTFDRIGKTECLNRVIPMAKGDIVLFTDANCLFPTDLIKKVSVNFNDPDIGLVTGWTKYLKAGGGEEATGVYAKLEKVTKYWESLVSSCVGADGAVFAIRKSLYQPLDAGDINDFIIPLRIVGQKKRAVLDPQVFCREEVADSEEKAYRRQVRITTRTLWAIWHNLRFLNFGRYGFFAFFLLSHKVLRLTVPFFLILGFVSNTALLGDWWIYNLTFSLYLVFIGAGLLGLFGPLKGGVASICKFFLITFSAQFVGSLRMVAGIQDITWTPRQ